MKRTIYYPKQFLWFIILDPRVNVHSCLTILMPCQILNCLRVNARIEQIRDVGMPQQVRCYIEIQGIANLGIVPLRCS